VSKLKYNKSKAAIAILLTVTSGEAQAQSGNKQDLNGESVVNLEEINVVSAGDQLKEAPGASIITARDIEDRPPVNDLADIIRREPGVNLTGTTASGQRGNQRQIDIRGMGPDNTLILIDGKPVLSRNSVRTGRAGERDSRGDTNWVPPEAVERIEVIRGPAAARYGSGAAGGVVNIITKRPEKQTTTVTAFTNLPTHSSEGKTMRFNILTGGPLNSVLSYMLMLNYNKTDADNLFINQQSSLEAAGNLPPAGREGVENKDVRLRVTYDPTTAHRFDFEGQFSDQRNLYAGDTQLSTTDATGIISGLAGATTNQMQRGVASLTHRGKWGFGDSLSYIQWENTQNTRNLEGLAGGGEGSINTQEKGTITLDNLTAKSEWNLPLHVLFEQTLTLGTEFRGEWMHDPVSLRQTTNGVNIPGTVSDPSQRSPNSNTWLVGFYVEDNIKVMPGFLVTPGLRFDRHSTFGNNLSPSLNAAYELTENISVKAGIARAFKAPNLFQINPNYVYYTMGNGCPINSPSLGGGCYVVGNPDLKAETSLNKEIGLNFHNAIGWNAGVTYFHNDYKNFIRSGLDSLGTGVSSTNTVGRYFQWQNVPDAVVSGLEGNLRAPIGEYMPWFPFSNNLTLNTNATYMIESRDKTNGVPLSLVPQYTINSWIEWRTRDDLSFVLTVLNYGRISSPERTQTTGGLVSQPLARGAYTLVNLGTRYDITPRHRLSAGINNVFDNRIFRQGNANNAGANTFNEPGRSYYMTLTATF